MLAEAVAPDGVVTGLDHSPDLLRHARQRVEGFPLSEQVDFRQGDVHSLPFENGVFDWVWSVDCVGFIPGDPVRLVKELARVVRPSGTVAFLLWSSQQLLPGYPVLEARLNTTSLGIAPFAKGQEPDTHYLRASGWLREAGLKEPHVRTFVGDVHAPLNDEVRRAVASLIDMRWGDPRSELTPDEWEVYDRLRHRDTPESIVDCPDYYAFFTYSMFWGRVD
jgi:demethylmenaquinone methyltransferase/2-methoxy-6-polyprenyl-1,4-benzoquinol methylase